MANDQKGNPRALGGRVSQKGAVAGLAEIISGTSGSSLASRVKRITSGDEGTPFYHRKDMTLSYDEQDYRVPAEEQEHEPIGDVRFEECPEVPNRKDPGESVLRGEERFPDEASDLLVPYSEVDYRSPEE